MENGLANYQRDIRTQKGWMCAAELLWKQLRSLINNEAELLGKTETMHGPEIKAVNLGVKPQVMSKVWPSIRRSESNGSLGSLIAVSTVQVLVEPALRDLCTSTESQHKQLIVLWAPCLPLFCCYDESYASTIIARFTRYIIFHAWT